MKKISIIIPVYNVEHYLQECLDSVYAQTYEDIEIICVYTKSKDKTYKVLKSQKDKRLKIIRRDDGGLGGARNTGLLNATGDYIFFLDSDDWIEKNAIETLYNIIIKEKSDLVVFPFYSFDDRSEKVLENEWGSNLNFVNVKSPFSCKELPNECVISDKSIVVAWNKLYKKSFLDENNIDFLEDLRYEDNPFYYKCLLKAKKISFTNKKLLYYRINRKGSLQTTNYDHKNVLDIVPVMSDIYNTFTNSTINNETKTIMENYVLNEFVWRYELMNRNVYQMRKMISKLFNNRFNDMFLQKIGIQREYIINLKKHSKVSSPKISIILPVYNVEKYIEDCILSIVNQSLKEIEIIFVDDNSTDESLKIIEDYQKIDNRIRYYKTEVNSGAGVARNIGLDNAKGEFILFMDPDDMYASDYILEELYTAAKRNHYSTICANIKVIEKNSHYKNYGKLQEYNGYNIDSNKIIEYKDYNIWCSWGFTRFMYSRSIIKNYNVRFPKARNYEDPLFLIDYMNNVEEIYQMNSDLYLYRYIAKESKMKPEAINNILNGMEKLFNFFEKKELPIHYSNEYRNLLNFIKYDFATVLEEKTNDSNKIVKRINSLLGQLNYDIILEYYDGDIIKKIPKKKKIDIKKILRNIKNKIKAFIKKIIVFFIKPFYSRLMNRVDNRINDKIQDLYLQRNVLDILYNRNDTNERSINQLFANCNESNKKIELLEKDNELLSSENNNYSKKIDYLKNEQQNNNKNLKMLENDNKVQSKIIKALETSVMSQSKSIDNLEINEKKYYQNIKTLEENVKKQTNNINSIEKNINNYKSTINSLEKNINLIGDSIEDNSKNVKMLEKENQKLVDLINNNNEDIKKLEKDTSDRETYIEEIENALKNENSFLKRYISDFNDYYKNRVPYKNSKIRICILFQMPSFWPSIDTIYDALKKDSDFELKLLLIENDKEKSQNRGSRDFLENNNIKYELATIDKIDGFNPHIIILQSPYDSWHRDYEMFSSSLFKKGYRIMYIPYGFEISDEPRSICLQYRQEFYSYCWKIYTCSEDVKKQYLKYNSLLSNNLVSLGSPRLDSIYHKRFTPIKEKIINNNKKNILLKIHFPLIMDFKDKRNVTPEISLYMDFLKANYRKEDYNLYVMLHPKFYDEMKPELVSKFKDLLKKSEATLIEDADYREILYSLDGVISDRSGTLIEFSALSIPILYMVNKNHDEIINPAFAYLFNSFDKGTTEEEMFRFIDSVINGEDKNKTHRDDAFKCCISNYDGKTSERIIKDIKSSIKEELNK